MWFNRKKTPVVAAPAAVANRPCQCGSTDFEFTGRALWDTVDPLEEVVCVGCGLSYAIQTPIHPDKPRNPIARKA